MDNLAIGILCYSNRYLSRINSWVRRLNPYVPVVIYHDNIRFSDEDYKLIDSKIKILEGESNKGTFLSRLNLIKYLSNNFNSFIMVDDDDYCISNIANICNKYCPLNEFSAIFFYGGILGTEESVNLATDCGIYNETSPAEPCVFMANALFNSEYMKSFCDFILNNLKLVEELFGTTRIVAGEDELLNYAYYWYVKTKLGYNKTLLSKEITQYSDTTMYGKAKYDIDDYRYSKEESNRDELGNKFMNNVEIFKDEMIKILGGKNV